MQFSKEDRLRKLIEVSEIIIETGNARTFIKENQEFIPCVIPADFISLFDELIKMGYSTDKLKVCSNKVLNIFHIPINDYSRVIPEHGSFISILEKNNQIMEDKLNQIRPIFKKLNKNPKDTELIADLSNMFKELELFSNHYIIKENLLFPLIEKLWPDYRCIQIMWSFHDDIRRNIKAVLSLLNGEIKDLKLLNRKVGDIFFNMLAIKFREELEELKKEANEIAYPYISPEITEEQRDIQNNEEVFADLGTGNLSLEQIILIFNNLPFDITYVDEHNRVKFFSTPKRRIFPRTKAVIGRDVHNCHPPESVHVVEKIIESFRAGQQDKAEFHIKLKDDLILIQYFAIRDNNGYYRGVLEVSQEITDIKKLKGEKRLLDW